MRCLYIFKFKPLLVTSFANIFAQPIHRLSFHLPNSSTVQKAFRMIQVHLFIFAFVALAWGYRPKIIIIIRVRPMSKSILLIFSSMILMVSGLTFKSLIHFEFIFICDVRRWFVLPTPFTEESVISPLYNVGSLAHKLIDHMSMSLFLGYSVPQKTVVPTSVLSTRYSSTRSPPL